MLSLRTPLKMFSRIKIPDIFKQEEKAGRKKIQLEGGKSLKISECKLKAKLEKEEIEQNDKWTNRDVDNEQTIGVIKQNYCKAGNDDTQSVGCNKIGKKCNGEGENEFIEEELKAIGRWANEDAEKTNGRFTDEIERNREKLKMLENICNLKEKTVGVWQLLLKLH